MKRLREEVGLEPVEYPTTRQVGASSEARAADLTTAFRDPEIKAVMATIGGSDQITVLPFLDPTVFSANPKGFFGYSDNTNLLNWLWNLGIASYHGGSTMVHLGRPGGLHPDSTESLRAALFTDGDLEIRVVEEFSEDEILFADVAARETEAPKQNGGEWTWHNAEAVVTAPTWGGNLEILHWNLAAGRWIRPVTDYEGCVLILETSQEMPSGSEVFHMLRNAGERGLLAQFPAVLMARPTSTNSTRPLRQEERQKFRGDQREAVLRAFSQYAPGAMIVFGVDFGHTDPQWIIPYGGRLTVDGPKRRITAHYG
jgi:muramoyltetrapeptide carboxypeptidase LdcA involved in peptidoglycan recycling